MIKSKETLRRPNFRSLAAFDAGDDTRRCIDRGPIYQLRRLQAMLASGDFDTTRLSPANRDVLKDMRHNRWTACDVLQMIVNMLGKDYRKSEWARVDSGRRWVACDVYQSFYDRLTRRRHRNAQPIYLKFSIDEAGDVVILVASCHGSS